MTRPPRPRSPALRQRHLPLHTLYLAEELSFRGEEERPLVPLVPFPALVLGLFQLRPGHALLSCSGFPRAVPLAPA